MLQACKNIMSVTADYNSTNDIKGNEFVINNVYMNLVIIIESFLNIDEQTKETLLSKDDIKYYTDLINNDFNQGNFPKIMYVCKNVIPQIKNKLEAIIPTL